MQKIIETAQFLILHGPEILSAIVGLLTAVIGISLLIPGEQPEKTLKKIVAFLEKFSKKQEKEEG